MYQNYAKYALALSGTSVRNTDILDNNVPFINLRSFEIPAAYGLQICRYNSELAEYFEEDKEIIFYHNDQELREKVNFYLHPSRESLIMDMKKASRDRLLKEHTWHERFKIVFKKMGLKFESCYSDVCI